MKVLHVTESMGSGVEAALLDYVRSSSPDIDHSILFSSRGYHTGGLQSVGLRSVVNAGQGVKNLLRHLKPTLRDIQPDIVHFHSSWAGLVGRAAVSPRSAAIVYSPHSFFFDRTNLSSLSRFTAHRLEKILASRTDVIAAVSPHEQSCARKLGAHSVYVPHVASIPDLSTPSKRSVVMEQEALPTVVAVGRLSDQKDPDFFLAVKRFADRFCVPATWLWIGGGGGGFQQRLEDAGVRVTGWIDRSEAMSLVASADLYVHTAAWEGNPISLLEVEHLGVAAVVRSIPSVVSLGYPSDLVTPEDVGAQVVRQLTVESKSSPVKTKELEGQIEDQREALFSVYEYALANAAGRKAGRK